MTPVTSVCRFHAFVVAATLALNAITCLASAQHCHIRSCLPDDNTQDPPLCFSHTVARGVTTQSFGTCPDDKSNCDFCRSGPPCESRCSGQPVAILPPGAPCYYDEECAGPFAKCMQRVCKRSLHTHQRCSPEDPNDVCIFGQKSCFRGMCQGLKSGEACRVHKEGRDIDCNPGWSCYLGVCTPQLPRHHSCVGSHADECVRGCKCNLAIAQPACMRQYTLNLGEKSSEPTLCKSNYVDVKQQVCATVPDLEYRYDRLVVAGTDCEEDSQCPRTDGSFGRCLCKRWWDGKGTPGYCELMVEDHSRPSFKLFWETQVRYCHQSWSSERCAIETGRLDVLQEVRQDRQKDVQDPTHLADCGKAMLGFEFGIDEGVAQRSATCAMIYSVLVASVLFAESW